MDARALEMRLSSLVKGNSPERRKEHVLKAKSQGKKIIGSICPCMPEEVIYAAGMLPWRITGTWDSDVSRAAAYLDLDSCQYCLHSLEALLRGDLDFIDGMVGSDWDDDQRRLYDTWKRVSKPAFYETYSASLNKSSIVVRYRAHELAELASALERFSGHKITDDGLRQAIKVYNQTRRLLQQFYELRKRPVPLISGPEVLGITTASRVMDKAEFNAELQDLLPYLEGRQVAPRSGQPRILVSSDHLDNPRFLEIIEGEGCQVVMDDLDTGSRYFSKLVDEYADDLYLALAWRSADRPGDAAMFGWKEQARQTIQWAKDFRADGVIELFDEFSAARQWRSPIVTREMARENMPFIRISRGYEVTNIEQLRTRVGAFLEMLLEAKSVPGKSIS